MQELLAALIGFYSDPEFGFLFTCTSSAAKAGVVMITKTMVPAIKRVFILTDPQGSIVVLFATCYLPGIRYWIIIYVSAYIKIFCPMTGNAESEI